MSNTLDSLLDTLRDEGRISALDMEFTRLMARLGDDLSPAGGAVIALTSKASSSGHLCVDLPAIAGRRLLGETDFFLPHCDELIRSLLESGVAGRPGSHRPLVIDEGRRLYLYRYWHYEATLAAWLKARGSEITNVDEERLANDLIRYFPSKPPTGIDCQKVAAAVAALKPLCVISGGPGTGKTTTVVRILALLQGQSVDYPLKIALAAPTGKAAGRLQQSVLRSMASLSLDQSISDSLPTEAFTLHRLLGVTANSIHFRHNRENPLPYDVIVVDEASMIDLALMFKLTDAVAPRTRLVLLGDKDQLASVEAGAVLADICGESPGFSNGFRERIAALTGEPVEAAAGEAMPISDSIVVLRHSYRFSGESGVGALAGSINEGDAEEAQRILWSDRYSDVAELPGRAELMRRIVDGYRPYFDAVRVRESLPAILSAFDRFRVLCALRQGPFGVDEINRLTELALDEAGLLRRGSGGYAGMPVMVTRNDYNLGLFNGDIGILLPEETGEQKVCFPGEGGEGRRFTLSRLEHFETVFAMTVHKSQGSEFDDVILVLPDADSPVLTRELLYTAVTRARLRFDLSATQDALKRSISRRLNRVTGLGGALWTKP